MATKEDPTLQAVKTAIKTDQWHAFNDLSIDHSSFQIFKTDRDELSLSVKIMTSFYAVTAWSSQDHFNSAPSTLHTKVIKGL